MNVPTPSLLDIVTHTPLWVWPLLALLIWRGLKNTQARETDTRGLLLLTILSALSAYGIVSSGFSMVVGTGLLLGIAGGMAGGRYLEEHHPARVAAPGRLLLPGDWTTMATILVTFTLRYVKAVLGAVQPEMLTNPAVQLFSGAIGGFVAATLLTRMGLRLALLQTPAVSA
jgi:hypothetical protein